MVCEGRATLESDLIDWRCVLALIAVAYACVSFAE